MSLPQSNCKQVKVITEEHMMGDEGTANNRKAWISEDNITGSARNRQQSSLLAKEKDSF